MKSITHFFLCCVHEAKASLTLDTRCLERGTYIDELRQLTEVFIFKDIRDYIGKCFEHSCLTLFDCNEFKVMILFADLLLEFIVSFIK